ncbi:hypothetical protein RRG08_030427 [Elysia crispata]|uniref:Fibrinogen C-terminal domain-containing protein n=1 Tax=Elysia crispata TaxID=231223 RepID=A0AAE1CKE4_9GAST|nr:hypothetical protein RRG08_030427 [Elysia crispata]
MGTMRVGILLGCLLVMTSVMEVTSNRKDLEIKLDRQVSNGICSRLSCEFEDSTIEIESMKLNLVTAAGTKRNLIKVTKAKPNIKVSKKDMTGNGTLSSTSATLLLDLMNEETCNSGYFKCEAFYKTASGKKRRQFATAGQSQSPSAAQPNTASSSEAANITEIISEAVSESFTGLMEQAVAALAFVDTSSRVTTLEDLVFNRIPALENVCGGNDTEALEELEKRITVLETESSTSKGDEPEACERGMGDDVTKWYRPYALVTDNTINRQILCDTHTDGGGWIVLQRRYKGDVDFYRDWNAYKDGFGSNTGEFWIGNEQIYALTSKGNYELRIDFRIDEKELFAYSSSFQVGDEAAAYRLKLGDVSGTIGTYGLTYHNNQAFTTFDRDNDSWGGGNCAKNHHGAWWFRQCHRCNINGIWGLKNVNGVSWYDGSKWLFPTYTEMKIRRISSTERIGDESPGRPHNQQENNNTSDYRYGLMVKTCENLWRLFV